MTAELPMLSVSTQTQGDDEDTVVENSLRGSRINDKAVKEYDKLPLGRTMKKDVERPSVVMMCLGIFCGSDVKSGQTQSENDV